jgi:hypothetical protein
MKGAPMPSIFDNHPNGYTPEDAMHIDPSVPPFFRRYDWHSGLVIYGYAIVSEYPEDLKNLQAIWSLKKSFLAVCFSPACPLGEMGMTIFGETISKEDFMDAAEKGWPQ